MIILSNVFAVMIRFNTVLAQEQSHQELLDKKGRYAEIYHIQSHYYKEEKKGEESI